VTVLATDSSLDARYAALSQHFAHWEKTKDLIDQFIDLMLNLRQSGHPGGSRAKVHALVVTLLSGVMRWDIRHPEKRFGDRFILVAGHTIPLVYATLAVFSEALRLKHQQTGDPRYLIPGEGRFTVYPEDLLRLRRNRGLPGHAEMEGKSLFIKFNTGPSGHGSPAAAGEALALKHAGAAGVKVFAFEGEGGFTAGASHEVRNSAWGLGLDNLFYVLDWNDFGIDDYRISSVVHGTPTDWFASYGWRVLGSEQGSEWGPVTRLLLELVEGPNPDHVPSAGWIKTRKGRGYGVFDNKAHGVPLPMNSPAFWETKRPFAEKYGVQFDGFGQAAPATADEQRAQTWANIQQVVRVLRDDQALVDYLADTLVALGDSVPADIPTFNLRPTPIHDERLYDFEHYPAEMYVAPGTKIANRAALAKWGAWVNAFCAKEYGRPLFLAASADLAESTNLAGFARAWGDFPGYGWYNRTSNLNGVLLPQEITEFTNAGIMAGLVTVNFADDPWNDFNGFYGACSTYGSFIYLKYGPMRLLSQLSQDCQLQVGKVLWVAGHSGPETADDSRTHFGIFSPGVTQLFPDGQIINVHPWEHNEVPVVIAAALRQKAPIVALHLTRPPITVPDRAALGLPSHFAAARGAYVLHDYRPGKRMGAVIVQGTSAVNNVLQILPELERRGLNVKIVVAISPELFALQPEEYRHAVLSPADRLDSMGITTQARRLLGDWLFTKTAAEYTLSADWDNRWRTGGTVDEVLEEAHLSPPWLLAGIERFVRDRDKRLGALRAAVDEAFSG